MRQIKMTRWIQRILICTQTGAAVCIFTYSRRKPLWHLDLVCEGYHPWTIDLATVTVAAILVVAFAGALVAHLVP